MLKISNNILTVLSVTLFQWCFICCTYSGDDDDRLTEEKFSYLVKQKYQRSLAEPGEAVGLLAAQVSSTAGIQPHPNSINAPQTHLLCEYSTCLNCFLSIHFYIVCRSAIYSDDTEHISLCRSRRDERHSRYTQTEVGYVIYSYIYS